MRRQIPATTSTDGKGAGEPGLRRSAQTCGVSGLLPPAWGHRWPREMPTPSSPSDAPSQPAAALGPGDTARGVRASSPPTLPRFLKGQKGKGRRLGPFWSRGWMESINSPCYFCQGPGWGRTRARVLLLQLFLSAWVRIKRKGVGGHIRT